MSSDSESGEFAASVSPTNHPQVAKFTLTAPPKSTVTVQFGTTTSYGLTTAPVPAPPGGGSVSILVAGMRAATLYHMRARIELPDFWWRTTPDETFMTGPLPPGILPTVTASTTPGQSPSPGVELVNVIDPVGISVVTDLAANILWYYNNTSDKSWEGYAFPIRPLQNGNMLASITNLYSANVPQTIPYNSVLREIDLAGNPVRQLSLADLNAALSQMKTPQGSVVQALCYSHDVLPLWNGHTILLVQEQRSVWLTAPPGPGQFTILGDALVDLDENFKPVWVWSVFDNLDVNRHPYEFDAADGYDWTHCNCVHWNRDASVDELLSLFERLNKEVPITKLRWSIAHLNDASERTLLRMKALGMGWTVQDAMYFQGEQFQQQNGAEAARRIPPVNSAKRIGVTVGAGTDAHRVASYNPFTALQWFLDGKTVGGVAIRGPEETPTRGDALRFYTMGSAWFSFDETKKGSLEVGKFADLAVLTKDYMTVPVDQIGGIESLLTMVGGKVVYAASPFERYQE